MSCLRCRTLRISVLPSPTSVPKRAAFRARWATRALHNSFLDGIQATAGHEPPTQRRSTTTTFLPDRPRCQARCLPPWPLPRMTTSKYSCWGMAASFLMTWRVSGRLTVDSCSAWSVEDHHHLSCGLVGLHHAMRLADLLEAEYTRRLCPEAARRHLPPDVLEQHIRQRATRRAEHEAAEERQVDAARHLQQRIEVGDRCAAAQPTGQAGAATPAQHGEGIENRAVAHEVQHGVELLGLGDALGKVRPLQLDAYDAQLLQHGEPRLAARGGDDPQVGIHGHADRSLAEGRGRAPNHQCLALGDFEVAEQPSPPGPVVLLDPPHLPPEQIRLYQRDIRHTCAGIFGVAP